MGTPEFTFDDSRLAFVDFEDEIQRLRSSVLEHLAVSSLESLQPEGVEQIKNAFSEKKLTAQECKAAFEAVHKFTYVLCHKTTRDKFLACDGTICASSYTVQDMPSHVKFIFSQIVEHLHDLLTDESGREATDSERGMGHVISLFVEKNLDSETIVGSNVVTDDDVSSLMTGIAGLYAMARGVRSGGLQGKELVEKVGLRSDHTEAIMDAWFKQFSKKYFLILPVRLITEKEHKRITELAKYANDFEGKEGLEWVLTDTPHPCIYQAGALLKRTQFVTSTAPEAKYLTLTNREIIDAYGALSRCMDQIEEAGASADPRIEAAERFTHAYEIEYGKLVKYALTHSLSTITDILATHTDDHRKETLERLMVLCREIDSLKDFARDLEIWHDELKEQNESNDRPKEVLVISDTDAIVHRPKLMRDTESHMLTGTPPQFGKWQSIVVLGNSWKDATALRTFVERLGHKGSFYVTRAFAKQVSAMLSIMHSSTVPMLSKYELLQGTPFIKIPWSLFEVEGPQRKFDDVVSSLNSCIGSICEDLKECESTDYTSCLRRATGRWRTFMEPFGYYFFDCGLMKMVSEMTFHAEVTFSCGTMPNGLVDKALVPDGMEGYMLCEVAEVLIDSLHTTVGICNRLVHHMDNAHDATPTRLLSSMERLMVDCRRGFRSLVNIFVRVADKYTQKLGSVKAKRRVLQEKVSQTQSNIRGQHPTFLFTQNEMRSWFYNKCDAEGLPHERLVKAHEAMETRKQQLGRFVYMKIVNPSTEYGLRSRVSDIATVAQNCDARPLITDENVSVANETSTQGKIPSTLALLQEMDTSIHSLMEEITGREMDEGLKEAMLHCLQTMKFDTQSKITVLQFYRNSIRTPQEDFESWKKAIEDLTKSEEADADEDFHEAPEEAHEEAAAQEAAERAPEEASEEAAAQEAAERAAAQERAVANVSESPEERGDYAEIFWCVCRRSGDKSYDLDRAEFLVSLKTYMEIHEDVKQVWNKINVLPKVFGDENRVSYSDFKERVGQGDIRRLVLAIARKRVSLYRVFYEIAQPEGVLPVQVGIHMSDYWKEMIGNGLNWEEARTLPEAELKVLQSELQLLFDTRAVFQTVFHNQGVAGYRLTKKECEGFLKEQADIMLHNQTSHDYKQIAEGMVIGEGEVGHGDLDKITMLFEQGSEKVPSALRSFLHEWYDGVRTLIQIWTSLAGAISMPLPSDLVEKLRPIQAEQFFAFIKLGPAERSVAVRVLLAAYKANGDEPIPYPHSTAERQEPADHHVINLSQSDIEYVWNILPKSMPSVLSKEEFLANIKDYAGVPELSWMLAEETKWTQDLFSEAGNDEVDILGFMESVKGSKDLQRFCESMLAKNRQLTQLWTDVTGSIVSPLPDRLVRQVGDVSILSSGMPFDDFLRRPHTWTEIETLMVHEVNASRGGAWESRNQEEASQESVDPDDGIPAPTWWEARNDLDEDQPANANSEDVMSIVDLLGECIGGLDERLETLSEDEEFMKTSIPELMRTQLTDLSVRMELLMDPRSTKENWIDEDWIDEDWIAETGLEKQVESESPSNPQGLREEDLSLESFRTYKFPAFFQCAWIVRVCIMRLDRLKHTQQKTLMDELAGVLTDVLKTIRAGLENEDTPTISGASPFVASLNGFLRKTEELRKPISRQFHGWRANILASRRRRQAGARASTRVRDRSLRGHLLGWHEAVHESHDYIARKERKTAFEDLRKRAQILKRSEEQLPSFVRGFLTETEEIMQSLPDFGKKDGTFDQYSKALSMLEVARGRGMFTGMVQRELRGKQPRNRPPGVDEAMMEARSLTVDELLGAISGTITYKVQERARTERFHTIATHTTPVG